jgi:hypothetical protein
MDGSCLAHKTGAYARSARPQDVREAYHTAIFGIFTRFRVSSRFSAPCTRAHPFEKLY